MENVPSLVKINLKTVLFGIVIFDINIYLMIRKFKKICIVKIVFHFIAEAISKALYFVHILVG